MRMKQLINLFLFITLSWFLANYSYMLICFIGFIGFI